MIGKRIADASIADCRLPPADSKRGALPFRLRSDARASKDERHASGNPQSAIRKLQSKGFTLLELMIVISILVILALIAMSQYNRTVMAAKEATLREDLYTMRKMIDQYGADKGKLPQSLSDLQSAGYIHEIPIDPMTEQADWQPEFGEDSGAVEGGQGLVNVHSSSGDMSSNGDSRYSEW